MSPKTDQDLKEDSQNLCDFTLIRNQVATIFHASSGAIYNYQMIEGNASFWALE